MPHRVAAVFGMMLASQGSGVFPQGGDGGRNVALCVIVEGPANRRARSFRSSSLVARVDDRLRRAGITIRDGAARSFYAAMTQRIRERAIGLVEALVRHRLVVVGATWVGLSE